MIRVEFLSESRIGFIVSLIVALELSRSFNCREGDIGNWVLFDVNLLTFVDLLPIGFNVGVFLKFRFDDDLFHSWKRGGFDLLRLFVQTEIFAFLFFLLFAQCSYFFILIILGNDLVSSRFPIFLIRHLNEIVVFDWSDENRGLNDRLFLLSLCIISTFSLVLSIEWSRTCRVCSGWR